MRRRILFVDDDQIILEWLQLTLRGMHTGWETHFSDSGEDAVRMLGDSGFDVIVSDIQMPGMDGVELLTHVREKYPGMVRIVLSADMDHKPIMRTVRLAHQYISKPCQTERLKTTVDRAFSLKFLLNDESLRKLISGMETFPGLPATYTRITELLRDADGSIQDVGEVIGEDLGMSVKILQLVNSASYGMARQVKSPAEATVFLGLDTIRALVLTLGLFSGFESTGISKDVVEEIYHHSMKTGLLAKAIATIEGLPKDQLEEAFMAGLLHDLGKLVMVHNLPDNYGKLLQATLEKNVPIQDAEMQIFGATHEQIGAYLIGLWGLPDVIAEAVAFHHCPLQCPTTEFDPLGAVHVADALAHVDPYAGGGVYENRLSTGYLEHLGLDDRLNDWIDLALESDG